MPATEPDGFPYPDIGDPDNVPKDLKALADQVQAKHGAIDLANLVVPAESDGKILVVKDGAVAYRAMKGDGTIDEEGNFQLGPKVVGMNELGDKAVTPAKVDDDAIGPAAIAANAVGASEIAANAVGEGELADGSVSSRKLKPSSGLVVPTETLGLGGGYADIPGAELKRTPAVAEKLLVVATFAFTVAGGDPTALQSELSALTAPINLG